MADALTEALWADFRRQWGEAGARLFAAARVYDGSLAVEARLEGAACWLHAVGVGFQGLLFGRAADLVVEPGPDAGPWPWARAALLLAALEVGRLKLGRAPGLRQALGQLRAAARCVRRAWPPGQDAPPD